MSGGKKLWVVGVSHHSAPVEVRERLAFENGTVVAALKSLRGLPGIEEAALVSTCNRVEVVARADPALAEPAVVRDFLARARGLRLSDFAEHVYVHEDRDAVRHLFRVASSLDSMVVGEPQILGQLKDCYGLATEAETAGPVLHRVFHKSFSVAKRVRTQTGIAAKSVSVSSVAVDLATQIFETLGDKTALLVGAGKMSDLAARHLKGRGIGTLFFANRTFDRAVELARELRGSPVPFEDLPRYLRLADVVIGSTDATGYLLSSEVVQEAVRERSYRPMFLIDLAVPRNFDPRINDLENVYLYDIDDLEGVIADNRSLRAGEAKRAETIVEEEVASFWQWFQSLEVVPTIMELREKLEAIRRRELDRALGSLSALGDAERRVIEAMSEAIVNKILHEPVSSLKRENGRTTGDVAAARRLFGLDKEKPG